MQQEQPMIEVKDLAVRFQTYRGTIHAVRNVGFSINHGEALGIVGESGCGKSVTAHAIMQLLPEENSDIEKGSITMEGRELLGLSESEMRKVRGGEIGMIFQDPMTSLNPVLRIGEQLTESLRLHKKMTNDEAREKAVEMLRLVGIPFPEKRLRDYPHQFSGGMRQRVMIAMALACNPKLIIADEPTTALDVTIQAQILDLMADLKQKFNTSIILISHDLGVIAHLCDKVLVMYAGQVIERGLAGDIFHNPQHPYTQGLLASLPRLTDKKEEELTVIDGQPPDLLYEIKGCPFMPRCSKAMSICAREAPAETPVGDHEEHCVRCWLQQKAQMECNEAGRAN